jgi:hypothetical protein
VLGNCRTAADPAERIIYRGGYGSAYCGNTRLARPFDPERVEWRRCILKQGDFDRRDLGNTRHQIIGKRNRLRLPGGVIHKFLEQGGTNALCGTAGDLC